MKTKSDYKGIEVHNPKVGEAERIYYKESISPPVKASQIKLLDTSQCSQESEDLNLDLKEPTMISSTQKHRTTMKGCSPTLPSAMGMGGGHVPMILNQHISARNPNRKNTHKGGSGLLMSKEHSYALERTPHLVVWDSAKSTNMQVNSYPKSFHQLKIGETVQKLIQENYQTLICSVEDFLVNHSQSLEKGKVSKIPEGQCFLRLQEYLKLKDLNLFSLKMSKGYSITKKGKLSLSSFKRWKNWGIELNGWFLTANFSEFPRTERGYLLSEVLEEKPDQKYYLSEKATKNLMEKRIPQGKAGLSLQLMGKEIKEHKSKLKECLQKKDGKKDMKILEEYIEQKELPQQSQQLKEEEL